MLPEPGARFDRYRIESVLGEGGMGRAYRAFDERLQRYVALKILHPAKAFGLPDSRPAATDGAARLLREARLAAALDHPNAVAIFDVGEACVTPDSSPLPYIAMELIEGRSLRAYIGAPDVAISERLRWLADVARALAAAHRRGLVHRDVKPENVMIRDDGVVKVLDFGIARRVRAGTIDPIAVTQAAELAGTLTADGVVVGTPFYMAPEQMRGEPLDGRADQFSWAVMAYEVLCGQLPWDRQGDALKVVSQILSTDPPPLRTVAPEVPPAVEAIVMRALAKGAENRLASMDEIVLSLDTIGGRPTPLSPAAITMVGPAATVQSTKTSLATGGMAPGISQVPAAKRRPLKALVGGVAVLGVVGLAFVLGAVKRRPSVAADAAVTPVATGLMDLPSPKTTPEALSAYLDGMSALRRGDMAAVSSRLKRALELDPQLAPALFRLGYGLFARHPTAAREFFRRAMELRSTLTERDQQLLDAYAPIVQREPSDLRETRARLAVLAVRYPMDAEISFDLAVCDARLHNFDVALAEYDRALALDPGYGYAAMAKGMCLLAKGDLDGAIAAAEDCERIAPGVTRCFAARLAAEIQEGRCADLESDARKMIVIHPDETDGYFAAAQALTALGGPTDAVVESVSQARARAGDREGAKETILLELNIQVLRGNFTEAERLAVARDANPRVASSSDEGAHSIGAWARIEIASETGARAKAGTIATDYRARSQAWSHASTGINEPEFEYGTMMLATVWHTKLIPDAQYERERTAWLAHEDTKRDSFGPAYLWYEAYARPATTPEEAKIALDLLPKYEPLPPIWNFPADYAIGEVYRLAGRIDDAIPHLAHASKECNAINYPWDNTRAHFSLGQALEAKNDTPNACAAYRVVVDRWGHAKPRSVTGEAALARVRALKCPSP